MMYCTKCGSNLKGSTDRCPVCKYPVSKMKQDLSGPGKRERSSSPPKFAPPYPTEGVKKDMKWREQEREEVEVVKFTDEGRVSETGEDEVEEDPALVDGCEFCGSTPLQRCFFCLAPICNRHTVRMQIDVRGTPFGEKVKSCPSCASRKEGNSPSNKEAQEAGMFFGIKPYHEWKRVK